MIMESPRFRVRNDWHHKNLQLKLCQFRRRSLYQVIYSKHPTQTVLISLDLLHPNPIPDKLWLLTFLSIKMRKIFSPNCNCPELPPHMVLHLMTECSLFFGIRPAMLKSLPLPLVLKFHINTVNVLDSLHSICCHSRNSFWYCNLITCWARPFVICVIFRNVALVNICDIIGLPLPRANGLPGGRMRGYRSGQLLVLRMGNYPWRRMNHKLANGMKMLKGNGNTTTLLFSLKGLEILHQEIRGQLKTIVMEHLNGILFHKFGPANKQHTNHSSS